MIVTICISILLLHLYIVNGYQYHISLTKKRGFVHLNMAKQTTEKYRVKLLVDLKDIGKKGDIVFVSPSLWMNLMSPKKFAVKITDDQMKQLEIQRQKTIELNLQQGIEISKRLAELEGFNFKRKSGANGQLFGSVTSRQIMDELRLRFPEGVLDGKGVSILGIEALNSDLKRIENENKLTEVRKLGQYHVIVKVHPDLEPSRVVMQVLPEL